ncbi:MAG: 50S ribosomal protein L28 [Planctomycetaceae bacterium]|jgi:large subunit ribosomal protein L28|nr:50S ribosomal protein L28 [Planctomycetaceae bacterium]
MSRVCEICGKGGLIGNHIETRGKAKYLGGVGTKVTGITRRNFLPNLQNVRTSTENGVTKTLKVCTQCLRSGAVRKQVRNAPFKLAHELEAAAAGKRIGGKRINAQKNKKTANKNKTKK